MEINGSMVIAPWETEEAKRPKMERPKALIDGDYILYNCGFASQHQWYYIYPEDAEDEDDWTSRYKYKKAAQEYCEMYMDMEIVPRILYDSWGIAKSNTKNFIKKIQRVTRAFDNYVIYFSDDRLERYDIATFQTYKGNRIGAPKPHWYKQIKEYIQDNYNWECAPGLEADDLLSMNQKNDGTTIICTPDKDLNMVPGLRYKCDGSEVFEIDERTAQLSFYTQLLTGDATDNIPGLFKLTGKKAMAKMKNALAEFETDRELYEYVRKCYAEAMPCSSRELSGWDVVLLEIGQLLWMRLDENNWEIP